MLQFDARWSAAKEEDLTVSDRLIDGMREVYGRYWRRNNDYWAPCSLGWPSDHDPAWRLLRFACPRRAGGVYVITRRSTPLPSSAHVVDVIDETRWITDNDTTWGKCLLLGAS
jgi:hypothetical protein